MYVLEWQYKLSYMRQYPDQDYKVNTIFLRAIKWSYDKKGHCDSNYLDYNPRIDLGWEVKIGQISRGTS